MRVLSDGRIRRSAEEWKVILDRFGKSELPIATFCEKEEISRSALASWKKKLGAIPKTVQKRAPAIVELSGVDTRKFAEPSIVPSQTSFELALPGGVTLRWRG
jgi:hypothetical protein